MPDVIIAPDARDELRDIWETIAQDDLLKADEVVNVILATFERLAEMPEMGQRREFNHPALKGQRYYPVTRFPSYLIFYRPTSDGIEVVHVFRGERNLDAFFATGEFPSL
jgi:plasmid stabilization system protein ParE